MVSDRLSSWLNREAVLVRKSDLYFFAMGAAAGASEAVWNSAFADVLPGAVPVMCGRGRGNGTCLSGTPAPKPALDESANAPASAPAAIFLTVPCRTKSPSGRIAAFVDSSGRNRLKNPKPPIIATVR